jgi:hypothetical protein
MLSPFWFIGGEKKVSSRGGKNPRARRKYYALNLFDMATMPMSW